MEDNVGEEMILKGITSGDGKTFTAVGVTYRLMRQIPPKISPKTIKRALPQYVVQGTALTSVSDESVLR